MTSEGRIKLAEDLVVTLQDDLNQLRSMRDRLSGSREYGLLASLEADVKGIRDAIQAMRDS